MRKSILFCTLLATSTFISPAKADNPTYWHVSLDTEGEDVYWDSPTNIDPGYPRYDWTSELTQMDVFVSGLGWISLMDELPADVLLMTGTEYGVPYGSCEFVEEPGVFAANICEGIDELGYGYGSITGISFGSVSGYDLIGLRYGADVTVEGIPEPTTLLLLRLGSFALLKKGRS